MVKRRQGQIFGVRFGSEENLARVLQTRLNTDDFKEYLVQTFLRRVQKTRSGVDLASALVLKLIPIYYLTIDFWFKDYGYETSLTKCSNVLLGTRNDVNHDRVVLAKRYFEIGLILFDE
uniref:Uncharacterized protein n=1 Tax=Romanomermis culicivorax TaxID=13658 RepID=A0A915HIQ2_ROMCU